MRKLTRFLAILVLAQSGSAAFANPSMSDDFQSIMGWLSDQMVQGLAFNTGSTFDPPQRVTGYRVQPDWSLGVGSMPLDKSKFPAPQTQALKDAGITNIFPKSVAFPNTTAHLRIGLPFASDASFRFTDMTIPKGYKISPGTTGEGQSNSFGVGYRKHFSIGPNFPALAVGVNYNHVKGVFKLHTLFGVNNVPGFSATTDVNGRIAWDLNSIGVNAVLSQRFGSWTPFGGFGYNHASGSVNARLTVLADTPLINPVVGDASRHPESSAGRVIFGTQLARSWANFFVNGEVKVLGQRVGKSWIVQSGLNMPFAFGRSSSKSAELTQLPEPKAAEEETPVQVKRPSRSIFFKPAAPESKDSDSQMIFLQ